MASIYINMLELINNCYDHYEPTSSSFTHILSTFTGSTDPNDPLLTGDLSETWNQETDSSISWWRILTIQQVTSVTAHSAQVFLGCNCWRYACSNRIWQELPDLCWQESLRKGHPLSFKKQVIFLIMTNESTSTLIYTMPESRWIWKEDLWFICQGGCFTCPLVSGKW